MARVSLRICLWGGGWHQEKGTQLRGGELDGGHPYKIFVFFSLFTFGEASQH